ncbi:MAG: 50S ribosomal protein L37e [Promethearchaeota archaeon]
MGKGTPSMGKKNKAGPHVRCRRCGKNSFHKRHHVCAACGFGKKKTIRHYSWSRHIRASNGFKARHL